MSARKAEKHHLVERTVTHKDGRTGVVRFHFPERASIGERVMVAIPGQPDGRPDAIDTWLLADLRGPAR